MEFHRFLKVSLYPVIACGITSGANALPDGAPQQMKTLSQNVMVTAATAASSTQILSAALNQCVIYSYDKNGNRITQINAAMVSGANWGAPKYLCFIWGS